MSLLDAGAVRTSATANADYTPGLKDPVSRVMPPSAGGAATPIEQALRGSAGVLPNRTDQPFDRAAILSPSPGQNPTVRDVLLAIVTLHKSPSATADSRKLAQPRFNLGPVDDDGADDDDGIDLRKLILDSEIGGAMLRAIIDIKSQDSHGATFSVFGVGNFSLDVAPDLHEAIVSELSTGLTFRGSLTGELSSYQGYAPATVDNGSVPNGRMERVNIVRVVLKWIVEFIYSPAGALLSMGVALSLFLWVCVKSVIFLQRRASRYQ